MKTCTSKSRFNELKRSTAWQLECMKTETNDIKTQKEIDEILERVKKLKFPKIAE